MNPSRRSREPPGGPPPPLTTSSSVKASTSDKNYTTESIWSSLGRLKREIGQPVTKRKVASWSDDKILTDDHASGSSVPNHFVNTALPEPSSSSGALRTHPRQHHREFATTAFTTATTSTAALNNHRHHYDDDGHRHPHIQQQRHQHHHHHHQRPHHNGANSRYRDDSPKRVDFSRTNRLREVNWDGTYQDSIACPPEFVSSDGSSSVSKGVGAQPSSAAGGLAATPYDDTLTNSRDIRETDINFLNFSRQPGPRAFVSGAASSLSSSVSGVVNAGRGQNTASAITASASAGNGLYDKSLHRLHPPHHPNHLPNHPHPHHTHHHPLSGEESNALLGVYNSPSPYGPPPSLAGDSPVNYALRLPASGSSSDSSQLVSSAGDVSPADPHAVVATSSISPHTRPASIPSTRSLSEDVRWSQSHPSLTLEPTSTKTRPSSSPLRATKESTNLAPPASSSSSINHLPISSSPSGSLPPKLTKVEIHTVASGGAPPASSSKTSAAVVAPSTNAAAAHAGSRPHSASAASGSGGAGAEQRRKPKDFLHVRKEVEEKWASTASGNARNARGVKSGGKKRGGGVDNKDGRGRGHPHQQQQQQQQQQGRHVADGLDRDPGRPHGYNNLNSLGHHLAAGGGDAVPLAERDTGFYHGLGERDGLEGDAVDRKMELYNQLDHQHHQQHQHQRPRPMKKSITADLKDSEIMMKLKERLKYQRSLVSSSQSGSNDTSIAESSTSSGQGSAPPALPPRQPLTSSTTPSNDSGPPALPVKTRKVAAAHPSPSYKGFSESTKDTATKTNGTGSTTNTSGRKKSATAVGGGKKPFAIQLKKSDSEGSKPSSANSNSRHPPPPPPPPDRETRPKKPPSRIVASSSSDGTKRPAKPGAKNIITTSSWRAGQELILRELGAAPNSAKASSAPSSKDATKAPLQQQHHRGDRDSDSAVSRQPDGAETGGRITGGDSATLTAGNAAATANDDDDDNGNDDAKDVMMKSKNLYEDARNMLSELRMDPERPLAGSGAKNSKSRPAVKRKAPKAVFTESERQQQSTIEKQRHYDQDSVRKYMQRQKSERLKRQQQEREANQKANKRKEQMMKELAIKQKKTAKVAVPTARLRLKMSNNNNNKENRADLMDNEDESTLTEDEDDDDDGDVTPRPEEGDLPHSSTTSKRRKRSKEEEHHPHHHHPHHQKKRSAATTAANSTPIQQHSIAVSASNPANPATATSTSTEQQQPPPAKYVKFQGHNTNIDINAAVSDFAHVLQRHQANGSRSQGLQLQATGNSLSPRPAYPLGAESVTMSRGGVMNNAATLQQHRTNQERKQALAATAMSLSNRIAEETKKLEAMSDVAGPNGDLSQNSHKPPHGNYISRYDNITGSRGDFSIFGSDNLPGVGTAYSSSQQARQEEAASCIQAAYRGHNVRQSLSWELPSGATFGQRFRGVPTGQEQGRGDDGLGDVMMVEGGEDGEDEEDPSPLTDTSTFSEITATEVSEGMTGNKKSQHRHHHSKKEGGSHRQAGEGVSSLSTQQAHLPAGGVTSASSGRMWSGEPQPDPYSIMSIMARQNKHYRLAGATDGDAQRKTTTAATAAAGNAINKEQSSAFVASLDLTSLKQPVITSEERVVVGQTSSGQSVIARARYTRVEATVEEKPSPSDRDRGEEDGEDNDDDTDAKEDKERDSDYNRDEEDGSNDTSSQHSVTIHTRQSHTHHHHSAASTRMRFSRSQHSHQKHHHYQHSYYYNHHHHHHYSDGSSSILTSSDEDDSTRVKAIPKGSAGKKSGGANSYMRQVSDAGLETDVSQLSDDEPRATRSKLGATEASGRQATGTAPNTTGGGHANTAGGRLSPNSLANKMSASLNYYESVEESLRHLTGMERTRAVALAQQESVSMAQVLKARQQEHTADMRNLQLHAQQEAMEAQKQLEQTRKGRGFSTATLLEKEDNLRPDSRSNALTSMTSRSGGVKDSPGNRRIHRSSATTSLASVTRRSEFTASSRTPRDRSSATSASVKTAEDSHVGGHDSDSSIRTASDIAGAVDSRRDASKAISEDIEESYSMSFDESITDEESFRQVLPSESHRKEVVRRQSSEGALNKTEVSSHMTPYTDLSSLFVGEDSFNRFTADMVRQVMKEEEYRAQHQAALLNLREKALREKAKAELAWLQQMKQQPRDKGADDHFPNLDKKEKIIRRNLQEQQAEIRRLKEANKVASKERQLLLQQHEEIAKIQDTTKETRQRLQPPSATTKMDVISRGKKGARPSHIQSEEEIEEASDISESMKDYKSDSEMYKDNMASGGKLRGDKAGQKADKLDKLRLDQKYMTARQQRLEERKKRAKELLEWKRKLDEEEAKVFHMENVALQAWGGKEGGGRKEGGSGRKQQQHDHGKESKRKQDAQGTKKAFKPVPLSKKDDSAVVSDRLLSSLQDETAVKSRTEAGSISEVISTELSTATGTKSATTDKRSRSASDRKSGTDGKDKSGRRSPIASGSESSIPEEVPTGSNDDKQKVHDSSDDTIINSSANDDYTDTFEPERTSSLTASRKKSPVGKLLPQGKSPLPSPWSRKTGSESESEDSISHTETMSDASDYEVRIRQLSDELRRRRKEVEILKKERSKRQKDKLKAQEEALKKQLDAYNNYIQQLKSDKDVLEHDAAANGKSAVRPQIKQPRSGQAKTSSSSRHRNHSDDFASNSSSFEDMRDGTDSNQTSPSIDGKDIKLLVDEKGKKKAAVSLMDRISEGSESQSDKSGGSGGKGKGGSVNKRDVARQPAVGKSKMDEISEKTTSSSSVQEAIDEESNIESLRSDKTSSAAMLKIETGNKAATDSGRNRKGSESWKEDDDVSYSMDFSENLSTLAQSHNRGPGKSSHAASSIQDSKGRSEADISEQIEEASAASSIHSASVSNQLKLDFMPKPSSGYSQGSLMSPPTTGIQESDSETEYRINSNHTSAKSEGSSRPSSEKSMGSVFSVEDVEDEDDDIISYSSDKVSTKQSGSAAKLLPPVAGSASGAVMSRTDDDVSEHISGSLPSISEKKPRSNSMRQDSQDVLDSLLGYEEGEDGDEDEKTPVPTPREMAMSDEEFVKEEEEEENLSLLMTDPLADFHLDDRVLVWGRRPGVLRFKGKVQFSPGIWAGVELDSEEGDSDGMHENKRYFTCRQGHGVMVHGSDISSVDDLARNDKHNAAGASGVTARRESVTDSRSLDESLTTDQEEDNGIDGSLDGIDSSALPAGDSSMLHSTPLSSPYSAKNGPSAAAGAAAAARHIQKPTATPVKGDDSPDNMSAMADSITDHLTTSLVQDSVEAMGKIANRKSPPALPSSPPPTLPKPKKSSALLPSSANDISASPGQSDDYNESDLTNAADQSSNMADRTTDGVMDSLLNEAISHMVSIKRRKAGLTGDRADNQDSTLKPMTVTPTSLTNGQLDTLSPSGKDKKKSALDLFAAKDDDDVDDYNDDDEEDDGDEKIKDNDSGLSMDHVQRPGSPLPGDGVMTAEDCKELDEDMNNLFGEYIDDDLGFEASPSSAKPQPSFSGDQTAALSPETSGIQEEITPVVPHTKDQIAPIIQEAVDIFWQRRRYGEPLDGPIDTPPNFLADEGDADEGAGDGFDTMTSHSRKSWRRMLFDLTGEVIRDIYMDEDKADPPVWQKVKHKTQKYFKGSSPPTTVDDLRPLVERAVFNVLDLNGSRRQNHTVNKWNVRKKKDAVDTVLVQELGEEEKGWVDYNQDELNLKVSLTDAIFDSLITDTAETFKGIYQQRSHTQI